MKLHAALIVLLAGLGVGCAGPRYSCPAPAHGACKSVSEVYADSIGSKRAKTVQGGHKVESAKKESKADAPRAQVFTAYPYAGVKPGEPLRRESRVLRVWVAPWVDKNGDWVDQTYLYVVVDRGGWRVQESLKGLSTAPAAGGGAP